MRIISNSIEARSWLRSIAKSRNIKFLNKFFRSILFMGNIFFFVLLAMSISVAYLYGPSGFFLWQHRISDLGWSAITPAPYLFDFTCIISGGMIIAISLAISKSINPDHKILSKAGLILGIIGAIGYVGIGVFSLDRAGPDEIFHKIAAILSFGGMVASIFVFSLGIIISNSKIHKWLGFYGIFAPLVVLIITFIALVPIVEWFLLFSILGFTTPANIKLII